MTTTKATEPRGAVFVAAGILLSRVAGLVRLRAFAHYFGLQSDAADAFNAAFRIPNLLQNLFGEGALSASFIPVYASLVGRGDPALADRVAGAVGALLALTTSALVAVGVAAAPALTAVIAPGFDGEQARADHSARARAVSGGGTARPVRLVPGRAEQPSPVPAVLRRPGDVERGDDR